jgi:cytochrome c2
MALESAKTRWPETSAEDLEKGRQLFLDNCSSCHSYPDRSAYSEKEWPVIARRMGDKVDMKEADTELLVRFILAERAAPSTPAQATPEPR